MLILPLASRTTIFYMFGCGNFYANYDFQGLILERAASFDDKILNLLEYDYISSRMIGYFVHPSLCFISLPS
uniref:Uncharacterized protein n=1 Tax=Cucumis sativus TaxID=3659 RepID=A0A0A0KU53_CUCSA